MMNESAKQTVLDGARKAYIRKLEQGNQSQTEIAEQLSILQHEINHKRAQIQRLMGAVNPDSDALSPKTVTTPSRKRDGFSGNECGIPLR